MTIAAYIDLNPVRAGVVNDPKDYRWSGYAEAVGWGGPAFNGISSLFTDSDLTKKEVLALYRQFLYCKVRYFSDGVIIGSTVFIERMLAEHTDQFSELRRRRGANKMKHGASCGLCSAGELRSTVVSSPA